MFKIPLTMYNIYYNKLNSILTFMRLFKTPLNFVIKKKAKTLIVRKPIRYIL